MCLTAPYLYSIYTVQAYRDTSHDIKRHIKQRSSMPTIYYERLFLSDVYEWKIAQFPYNEYDFSMLSWLHSAQPHMHRCILHLWPCFHLIPLLRAPTCTSLVHKSHRTLLSKSRVVHFNLNLLQFIAERCWSLKLLNAIKRVFCARQEKNEEKPPELRPNRWH